MKRIVFTVTNDLTYDQRMDRICSALAEEGFAVILLGREKNNSIPLSSKSYHQIRLHLFFQKGKFFYFEYNLRLFVRLLFMKYDIIGSVDLDTLLPCYLAAKVRRKNLVYDAHEYFTEVIEVVRRPLVQKMWLMLESILLPKITYAYTVCESLKRLFEAKYDVNFEVIRNISVLKEQNLEIRPAGRYIIYAGAVNEGRGLDECIEAMKSLDCKLYICGDGDIKQRLEKKVRELSLQEKIIFTGYLVPEKLDEMIRHAWLGVLLLENKGLSYYYSLANKFFDYLHAGIPQLTINFPEYKILNERHEVARLIDLDVNEIVTSVQMLMQDQEYYKRLVSNTQPAKLEWNWQNEKEKLVRFYRNL